MLLCSPETTGTWDRDIPGDRLYADTLTAELFGLDPLQAESGYGLDEFLGCLDGEDRARVRAHMHEAERMPGGHYAAEFRVRRPDGALRPLLIRGRIHRGADGRPLRGRGIAADLSAPRVRVAEPARRPQADALERAADLCLEAREAILEVADQPFLRRLVDMLLLEIGRGLARRASAETRRKAN
ncbi:hypothetical protein OPKNFCMD_1610 [Methylobacterium crusticola]|uniref:PAS fold-3 domain-containing protein n=1 Tax=Methylobacterium crusticola TaxID=1697972 RepID=A0ABQ4QUH7_9HYPH|nr:PAS domain-containing protein [Methylobacterium crusticola]GJD48884.1 hypothetical protein OPKNFCMD_1610 [Methylobacterium crusticola]